MTSRLPKTGVFSSENILKRFFVLIETLIKDIYRITGVNLALTNAATVVYSIMSFVASVLIIISYWKIFVKAGERGWKIFIPVYNVYILYKISGMKKRFWLAVIAQLVSSVLMFRVIILYADNGIDAVLNSSSAAAFFFGALALSALALVISVVQLYKFAKAFGHGVGYFFGILFFPFVFLLILAFGKSQYVLNGKQ